MTSFSVQICFKLGRENMKKSVSNPNRDKRVVESLILSGVGLNFGCSTPFCGGLVVEKCSVDEIHFAFAYQAFLYTFDPLCETFVHSIAKVQIPFFQAILTEEPPLFLGTKTGA